MRKEYEEKLEQFYQTYPDLRPVKPEKTAKSAASKSTGAKAAEPEKPVILLPGAPTKPAKPFDLYFQQMVGRRNFFCWNKKDFLSPSPPAPPRLPPPPSSPPGSPPHTTTAHALVFKNADIHFTVLKMLKNLSDNWIFILKFYPSSARSALTKELF